MLYLYSTLSTKLIHEFEIFIYFTKNVSEKCLYFQNRSVNSKINRKIKEYFAYITTKIFSILEYLFKYLYIQSENFKIKILIYNFINISTSFVP